MKIFLISILLIFIGSSHSYARGNDVGFADVVSVSPIDETDAIEPNSDILISTSKLDYKQTDEWKKYKLLRAIGWTAFGIGLPTLLLPAVGFVISGYSGGGSSYDFSLMIPGAVLTLMSVPILVNANRFRDKAKSLSFTLTSINAPRVDKRMAFSPAVGFSVRF